MNSAKCQAGRWILARARAGTASQELIPSLLCCVAPGRHYCDNPRGTESLNLSPVKRPFIYAARRGISGMWRVISGGAVTQPGWTWALILQT